MEPKLIMIDLNMLSPSTVIGVAEDYLRHVERLAGIPKEQQILSEVYQLKAMFYACREHLDKDIGKAQTDELLPVSDWSIV